MILQEQYLHQEVQISEVVEALAVEVLAEAEDLQAVEVVVEDNKIISKNLFVCTGRFFLNINK